MTATTTSLTGWAAKPMGRAVRIAIAAFGMLTATFVLLLAAVVSRGSWVMVFLGVGLAACSVAAARVPSTIRLIATAAALVSVPVALQLL